MTQARMSPLARDDPWRMFALARARPCHSPTLRERHHHGEGALVVTERSHGLSPLRQKAGQAFLKDQ